MANDRETQRLRSLRDYDVLDSANEDAFDDLVLLAARFTAAPMATISFLDGRRQWFKASRGLPVTETERRIALCDYTIRGADVFAVEDTLTDPRFAANPLVTGEPRIRAYAGVPLLTVDGAALGSLAVMDHVPRQFTPEQIDSLRRLARQVMTQLELRQRKRGAQRAIEAARLPPAPVADAAAQAPFDHRPEVELRDLTERFRAVLRATVDIVWDWNLHGTVVWWNDGMQTLFGWHEDEIGTEQRTGPGWCILMIGNACSTASTALSKAVANSGSAHTD